MDLALLVNQFNVKGRLVTIVPFGNGNINDTFLAVYRNTFTETQVIVQKVNRAVFTRGGRGGRARRPRVADAAHHQDKGRRGFRDGRQW